MDCQTAEPKPPFPDPHQAKPGNESELKPRRNNCKVKQREAW
jgi:hypothetical protein